MPTAEQLPGPRNIEQGKTKPAMVVFEREQLSPLDRLKEKSFADKNPFLTPIDFSQPQELEAIKLVTRRTVHDNDGIQPTLLESKTFPDGQKRFVAEFTVEELSDETRALLQSLTTDMYTGMDEAMRTQDNVGLFIDESKSKEGPKTIVIRDNCLFQTDFVEYTARISTILARGEEINNPSLTGGIYRELLRGQLENAPPFVGYMQQLEKVTQSCILPLTNLEKTHALGLKPKSVLVAGTMQAGKTAFMREVMRTMLDGTNVLPVAVDPKKDMHTLSLTFARLDEIQTITQEPVVLLLDDLQSISDNPSVLDNNISIITREAAKRGMPIVASTKRQVDPQAFGEIVHLGLPDYETRKGILEIHAAPLLKDFDEKERERILTDTAARRTENFTPGQLVVICREAKILHLKRLTTDAATTFNLEDWTEAVNTVGGKYNKQGIVKDDEAINDFATHHSYKNQKPAHKTPGNYL